MAEIDATGFIGKTENEYFSDEIALYQGIDPEWNLDVSTPDGLKAASDAEIFTNLDEAARLAYNSKDPAKSQGVELNVIGSLTGAVRSIGTSSDAVLTVGGVGGTIVLAGSIVESTLDDTQWLIDSDVTIPGGGTITVGATAVIKGAAQADIGTLTRIIDTIGGWQTVTNLAVATPGTNPETNAEFRLRRAASVGKPGNNQIDSLTGEIFSVEDVRRVKVLENFTNAVDVNGLPPHSFAAIVDGGDDDDIAFAIYVKKNPGCDMHAAGTPVVIDVTSPVYPLTVIEITYSRPLYIDIDVVVEITNDGTLPANADELIKTAIIEYTQGDLIPTTAGGFNVLGFDIGEDANAGRLYTPVNSVIGAYGNSLVTLLTVDESGGGSPGQSEPIAFNELSRWTEPNITVTIT